MTRCPLLLCLGPALALMAACASPRITEFNQGGYGYPCEGDAACIPPLVCAEGSCSPSGAAGAGDACVIDLDCAVGLRCAAAACAPAGEQAVGQTCARSADCQRGLRCEVQAFVGTCTEGGTGWLDAPCTSSSQCLPGLLCDPAEGSCQATLASPVGDPCDPGSVTACSPASGVVCDAATSTCVGTGPDGEPTPPWAGASCPPVTNDGPFHVLFELDASGDDFFRLPFPNDARLTASGGIDLDGFPAPPNGFLEEYLTLAAGQDGFGTSQSVYFRFSTPPQFCGQCSTGDVDCLQHCMGTGEQAFSVYLVDLEHDGAGSLTGHRFWPVSSSWRASSQAEAYICGPWFSLAINSRTPWQVGHTYAVFIHSDVRGGDGDAMVQDDDLVTMLSDTEPTTGTPQHAAWQRYTLIRQWLASSPTFLVADGDLHAGNTVQASDIGGLALFTVRDPTAAFNGVADSVETETPSVSDVATCADTAEITCAVPATEGFTEVHGTITLPNLQQGTAPYETEGGGVGFDGTGTAQLQGMVTARFAISLPNEPATGPWPVIIYSHGTGGDFRSHIREGIARTLASVGVTGEATPAHFAVVGIDQVAHGPRKGSSTWDENTLFFNAAHPEAARGNVLQAAADQISVLRALQAISDALPQGSLTVSDVAFLGHSQGGLVGAVAGTRLVGVEVYGLSGVGAGLVDGLVHKTSPFPTFALLRFALADGRLTPDGARAHPAVNLIQSVLDDADPYNFAVPLRQAANRHVLHVIGVGDTFTPNVTAMTYGRRLQSRVAGEGSANPQFLDDDGSGLLVASDSAVTAPVSNNMLGHTIVSSIHAPTNGADGHFVLFDDDVARARVAEFFGSWLFDGAPTVVDGD